MRAAAAFVLPALLILGAVADRAAVGLPLAKRARAVAGDAGIQQAANHYQLAVVVLRQAPHQFPVGFKTLAGVGDGKYAATGNRGGQQRFACFQAAHQLVGQAIRNIVDIADVLWVEHRKIGAGNGFAVLALARIAATAHGRSVIEFGLDLDVIFGLGGPFLQDTITCWLARGDALLLRRCVARLFAAGDGQPGLGASVFQCALQCFAPGIVSAALFGAGNAFGGKTGGVQRWAGHHCQCTEQRQQAAQQGGLGQGRFHGYSMAENRSSGKLANCLRRLTQSA